MMKKSTRKITVSYKDSSPYQNYPQGGDTLFIVNERSNSLPKMKEWIAENITSPYQISVIGPKEVGIWFSSTLEAEKFEKEWL